MIKTASALTLAVFLFACGGGSKATKDEPAAGGEGATPVAEAGTGEPAAPAAGGEQAKAGEPAAQPTAGGEAAPFTEAEWEDAVVLTEKLADIVAANKDDCDQMAAAVETFFDENQDLIARSSAWQKTAAEEEQQRFIEKYEDRIKAMGMKVGEGVQKCANHQGVMEQFQRFQ